MAQANDEPPTSLAVSDVMSSVSLAVPPPSLTPSLLVLYSWRSLCFDQRVYLTGQDEIDSRTTEQARGVARESPRGRGAEVEGGRDGRG